MGKSVKPIGNTSGVKAQNVEWFASDIIISNTGKIRFNVAVSTAVIVEITKDSGTTWVDINGVVALVADDETSKNIPVRAGDLFNARTTDGAGTTVRYCRLDFITNES